MAGLLPLCRDSQGPLRSELAAVSLWDEDATRTCSQGSRQKAQKESCLLSLSFYPIESSSQTLQPRNRLDFAVGCETSWGDTGL